MEARTIHDVFRRVVSEHTGATAYRFKTTAGWQSITWSQQLEQVLRISRALVASGVEHGDRVAILSGTRLEWVQADFAILEAGGVTVGIYHSNLAEDCAYILEHAEARLLFVENAEQLAKVASLRDRLRSLRTIVSFEGGSDSRAGVLGWTEFLARGASVPAERVAERASALGPDDLASFVYTSGTTGTPKAAMLTHRNLVFAAKSAVQCLPLEPGYETLLFLPLAHVFARLIVHVCMQAGVTVAFAEDLSTVPANLLEVRPHFIPAVPRVYEKVHERIASRLEQAGGLKKKLFDWALGVGRRASERRQRGEPIGGALALRLALADRLVLRKIRAAFGGRLAWAVSGAAPLNRDIAEFFDACGITILEGYGMTENASFTNVNRLDRNRFGTVGPVGPGIEIRIAEDGEILFRGDNVMKGYFKAAADTAEAIDPDGWQHSGDIGEIDADGFLRITDRKKDLIVTAGGKNVAPQRVERILRTSPYISQVMAYGDRRKFISALVTLDPDRIRAWAREHGAGSASLEELSRHPEVQRLIEEEIRERNRQLASFEAVKKFRILPRDFSIESGELTPTMKVKRKVVSENYRTLLDEIYAA